MVGYQNNIYKYFTRYHSEAYGNFKKDYIEKNFGKELYGNVSDKIGYGLIGLGLPLAYFSPIGLISGIAGYTMLNLLLSIFHNIIEKIFRVSLAVTSISVTVPFYIAEILNRAMFALFASILCSPVILCNYILGKDNQDYNFFKKFLSENFVLEFYSHYETFMLNNLMFIFDRALFISDLPIDTVINLSKNINKHLEMSLKSITNSPNNFLNIINVDDCVLEERQAKSRLL